MSDFSKPNEPKENTREDNISAVLSNSHLFRKGQLQCDWMELCGKGAPTLQLLLSRNMLGPNSKFIGVDTNLEVIEECRDLYPSYVFIHAEIQSLLRYQDSNITSRVGVLNYDSEFKWSGIYENDRTDLRSFVKRQHNSLGSFLLIVNGVCRDSGGVRKSKGYAQQLYSFIHREVYPGEAIPLNDTGITSYKGLNTKGSNTNWNMVHMRAMF